MIFGKKNLRWNFFWQNFFFVQNFFLLTIVFGKKLGWGYVVVELGFWQFSKFFHSTACWFLFTIPSWVFNLINRSFNIIVEFFFYSFFNFHFSLYIFLFPFYCHPRLHLGFSAQLRIWQVPTCKMEPRSSYIMQLEPPTHPPHQLEIVQLGTKLNTNLRFNTTTHHPPPTVTLQPLLGIVGGKNLICKLIKVKNWHSSPNSPSHPPHLTLYSWGKNLFSMLPTSRQRRKLSFVI